MMSRKAKLLIFRLVQVAIGTLLLHGLQLVQAQEAYPTRPIEIIVPFGPGGGSDITARMVSRFLEFELEVPVPVINQPGASGMIGLQRLMSRPADGYTLVVTGDAYYMFGGEPPRTKLDDLVPLAVLINQPSAIFAAENSRFRSWADVERESKAKPGSISIFIAGRDSLEEVQIDYLGARGIKLMSVPVPKPTERYALLLGSHGDLLYEQAGDVKSLLESNRIRPLLSLTEMPFPLFPNVPASKNLGYEVWTPQIRWMFARAGTDPARVQVLATALEKMSTTDEYRNFLRSEMASPNSFVGTREARAYVRNMLDQARKEEQIVQKVRASR